MRLKCGWMSRLAYCTLLKQNKRCVVISGFTRLMTRQIFLELTQGCQSLQKEVAEKSKLL